MGLKELLGRRLNDEQLDLARRNLEVRIDQGDYVEVTRYRTLPGGIRVEQDIEIDGKPYRSRLRDYTLDNELMTRCTIYFEEGRVGTKVTTTYDPPGCLFGDTKVSWPGKFFN